MLRVYARHLLASAQDADDVVQEVCVLALEQPALILRGDDPAAYLRGIVRHLAQRHRRRYRPHRTLDDLVDQAWDHDAPDQPSLATPQASAALAACLQTLGERARHLVEQRYRDDWDATRIGLQVGMSAEAVRMALMRARQALSRCLSQRLGSEGHP